MDESALAGRLDVPVTVFDATPDTSAHLRRRAREDAPHGTFAMANELTAGRGRTGDAWSAPPGGVWSSTLLYPELPPEHAGRLTVAGGLAAAEAVRSVGIDAALKWPNDVVVPAGAEGAGSRDPEGEARDRAPEREADARDRENEAAPRDGPRRRPKLAGVLTEAVVDAVPVAGKPVDEALEDPGELDCVVVGVGINADLSPDAIETDRPVTTMRAELGRPVDRAEVAAQLHERLLDRAAQVETDEGFAAALDDWRELAVTLGERVRVERRGDRPPVEGLAADVDGRGALVVETGTGTVTVSEGVCSTLRREPGGRTK